MIQKIIIEGEKNRELKQKINEIIDYLTAREEIENNKVEESSPVNMYRMTIQTATTPLEEVVVDEVPVGTVVETSERMVKVKREHGWDALTKENWEKEKEGEA